MTDELKGIVQGANSTEEKAQRIYAYVCSNFKAVSAESHIENNVYSANLRDVYNKKEGSVMEVNYY